MGKALLRLSIISVALYLVICYYFAQFYGVDLLRNSYTLLFELCLVVILFEDSSKYFCRFIKWTMLSVFISDTISHIDYYIDFISVGVYNYIVSFILFAGFGTSCTLALRHFYQVTKLKRKKKSYEYKIERD